jgi:aconitate decarboxylase
MTDKPLTRDFAEKLLAIDYRTLPPEAVDMARQVMLDGLGVMVAGAGEPLGLGRITVDYVRDMGGAPQASVIAGGFKTSMQSAAYANGTLAHALDWDNTWYPLNHPTSPTLPAILAIAEHKRLPGERIIEAIAVAFEVQGRVRLAATGLETGQGFHKPGTTGTFGATAAASKLLGLTLEQTLVALGLAGSRAGSMSINTGTMTKSSHSGHAARMGVECAVLAQLGWSAATDIFGPKGFFDTFLRGDAEPRKLVEGFAAPLRMVSPGVGFKKYPSNYFTHRPIDAALALRSEHGIRGEDIESVEIRVPPIEYVNRPAPRTGLDGKFSIQYAAAVALLDGDITIDSFTNQRRFAADLASLLPRVKLVVDSAIPKEFDSTWVVMIVRCRDGREYSQEMRELSGWLGHPLTREQRLRKFSACTRGAVDESAASEVLARVEQLERQEDISPVMNLLRDARVPVHEA